MKNILAQRQQTVLQRLASSGALLAFDYDGTLAPLVADPAKAAMRAQTRDLLAELSAWFPCAVVSGRARSDLLDFLQGAGPLQVVGNHGAEWGESGPGDLQMERLVALWIEPLRWAVSRLEGVVLEVKRFSLALHYRGARKPEHARKELELAAADLPASRLVPGRQALNVVPDIAPDKGSALCELLERSGATCALFVGDHDTDEAAFALGRQENVVGVRVERSLGSAAEFFVPSQRDVDALLLRLVSLGRGRRLRERGAA